jgi:hypothetical protein
MPSVMRGVVEILRSGKSSAKDKKRANQKRGAGRDVTRRGRHRYIRKHGSNGGL